MELLTQSALWQLVLGLAGLILTLAGILYVVDKCGAKPAEEIARRASTRGPADVVAATPDRDHGQAHHRTRT